MPVCSLLGIYHEQSRPDRDDFVEIIWNHVPGGTTNINFEKRKYSEINSNGFPYDYKSIMHYSGGAFGNGR